MDKIDMEYHHCGACGKYVGPEDGFYGDAERSGGQLIYCDRSCCMVNEPETFSDTN